MTTSFLHLESINVGQPRPSPAGGQFDTTGIDKQPVPRADIGVVGLNGDHIVDTKNHGGTDQAVYLYFRADYDHWQHELGRAMPPGLFGENLTVAGNTGSQTIRVGDRFVIETGAVHVVLEATAPRIPCAVFAHKLGETDWVRRFRDANRPGVYARVITPGSVHTDATVRHEPVSSGPTLIELQKLYYTPASPAEQLRQALDSPLAERLRDLFSERLRRRQA